MSMRVSSSDCGSWWIPFGVKDGAVALTLDEIQKGFDDFAFGQVPDQEASVMAGAQENIRVVRMRLQYESFSLMTD